jgi:hypothetical protein
VGVRIVEAIGITGKGRRRCGGWWLGGELKTYANFGTVDVVGGGWVGSGRGGSHVRVHIAGVGRTKAWQNQSPPKQGWHTTLTILISSIDKTICILF